MEERIDGMEELRLQLLAVNRKVDHMQMYLESEFGGHSLSGQPTEGNMNRQFKDIFNRISKLEDRTKMIEDWKMYILGGVGAIGILFSLVTLVIQVVKK